MSELVTITATELARLRASDKMVSALKDAWVDEGVNPWYHRRKRDQLACEWPVLATLLERVGRGDTNTTISAAWRRW
jgi:hypothetical protein